MYGKVFSSEFLAMQSKDKSGPNNPQFGVIKSADTLAKLIKLIYVYDSADGSFLGEFSTINCSNHFKMGKYTVTKYLQSGLPFKGKIFTRTKR